MPAEKKTIPAHEAVLLVLRAHVEQVARESGLPGRTHAFYRLFTAEPRWAGLAIGANEDPALESLDCGTIARLTGLDAQALARKLESRPEDEPAGGR